MIDVWVCQKNSGDRSVAQSSSCLTVRVQLRRGFDLLGQIGRCVNQETAVKGFGVAADCDTGLCLRGNFSRSRGDAVRTVTVQLGQTDAGCAAENMDPNQPEFRSNYFSSIRPRPRNTCTQKRSARFSGSS